PVPEQVNIAYGETRLTFGKEYIIPKPFDPRLIARVPPAVAKAAIQSGVAKEIITDWNKYEDELLERMGSDNKIVRLLINRAKTNPKRVVYTEADQMDVLKAAQIVFEEKIGVPILLGRKETILSLMEEIDFNEDIEIIDPKDDDHEEKRNLYAQKYWENRRRNGVTLYQAKKLMRERNYYAAMMINQGDADALITGHSRSYPSSLMPILEVIGKLDGVDKVATTNLMITKKGPIFLSDTSINIDPTAKELAKIAQMTAFTMKMFGMEPILAMISYANFG